MKIFTRNIGATPRRREGLPRRGVARLGRGRLRLGVLAMVRGLGLWPVSGGFRVPVCDCCDLLRGPLCDNWSVSLLD